jgi:sugar phosphate isomerase/epimerase
MTAETSRRRFLKMGAFATASTGLLGCGQPPEGKTAAKSGTSQPQSTEFSDNHPRLFPGCCALSFQEYLVPGKMTMPEVIEKVVEMGSIGLDMTVYWFKSTEPAYLADLRHMAFRKGVPFSGAACGSTMVEADAAKRRQVLADIKKWVDVTDRLGASHLRIFSGRLPSGATLSQGIDWVVETMKPACEYSGEKGITLGIENHDGITQTADVCLDILNRVNSPYAGINLDITNFKPTRTADVYGQIKACIPHATHTHIREHFGDGSAVDLDRVFRMFAEGGYKGFMSAEYEYQGKGSEGTTTGLPKLMDKIKTLCRKYSTA